MSELEQLARAFANAPDENARLRLAVDSAVTLVDRCEPAGITVNESGEDHDTLVVVDLAGVRAVASECFSPTRR